MVLMSGEKNLFYICWDCCGNVQRIDQLPWKCAITPFKCVRNLLILTCNRLHIFHTFFSENILFTDLIHIFYPFQGFIGNQTSSLPSSPSLPLSSSLFPLFRAL